MTDAVLRCERCESRVEPGDLRCPICNLTCPETRPDDRPETAVDVLRCTGCGAAMTYDVRERAAACAFCGSVLEVEHPDDPLEDARQLIPFTVDRPQAESAFRAWLGTLGWFRPGDLVSSARLETIRPLRWVAWVFDAHATASWAADTDRDAQRADWAPHAGVAELEFDDVVVPATRGLSDAEATFLIPSYDLSWPPTRPDVVENAEVERFDVPRSTARRRLVAAVEELARKRLREGHVPGRRIRNLATSTVLRGLEARRAALPAWVLAYRYRGTLYRTVLSGQDPNRLLGSAPYSTTRILAAVAAGAALVLLLLALVVG